jgi:hypothetical protein
VTRSHSPVHTGRGILLALATLLALTVPLATLPALPALADTPTDDPAEAATGWLVSVLTDDPAVDTGFGPSAGPTIDVLLALAAVGVAADTIEDIADWLATQSAGYTQGVPFEELEDTAYAGATAKLALAMLVVDRDPRAVGGLDLLEQLASLEVTDPDDGIVGRFQDRSGFGEFSSPLTQSLALLTLARAADATPSAAAVAALADQACADGGYPSTFAPETCTSSVDTTGYAIQALLSVGADDEAGEAADWLVSIQADDGSFSSSDGVNTNSTGLAATALAATGRTDAAADARDWIVTQQDDCDADGPGAIPFRTDERGSVELATAQAAFGLSGASLATVSRAGARADVPVLDCPVPVADEPVDDRPVDAPDDGEDGPVTNGRSDGASAPGADVTRPTQVDAGLSPSLPVGTLLVALLGAILVLGGLTAGWRARHEPR